MIRRILLQFPSPNFNLVLILILGVGTFLRFWQIGQASLTMDEIWSIEISTGRGSAHDLPQQGILHHEQIQFTTLGDAPPWWRIWTNMDRITHPPLYHVLLRWWMDLFGNSAAATRSMSAVLSLISIWLLFDICRLLHGIRIALLAAAMMSFSIAQIDFAQQARSYAMMTFLALAAADCLVRIELFSANWRRLATLVILLPALALTHYFSIVILFVLGIYAAIRLRGDNLRKTLAAFGVGGAVCVVLWAPWFIRQIRSLPSYSPGFITEAGTDHVRNTFERITEIPIRLLLGDAAAVNYGGMFVGILGIILLAFPLVQFYRKREVSLWSLWLVVSVGSIAVMDLLHDSSLLGFLRYTMIAGPGIYAMIAAINWPRRASVRDSIVIAIIAFQLMLNVQSLGQPVVAAEDWHLLADKMNSPANADEPLVFFSSDPWASPGVWYMAFRYYHPESTRPWMLLTHAADENTLRQLSDCSSVRLIYPASMSSLAKLPNWNSVGKESTSAGKIEWMEPQIGPDVASGDTAQ